MQSGVFAFIVIHVDGNFFDQAERLAVGGLEAFEVGSEDVVGVTGGNALGKLSVVIGVNLPFGLFVLGAADFDKNAVDGTIVGPDKCRR